jgi:uncharacterized protein
MKPIRSLMRRLVAVALFIAFAAPAFAAARVLDCPLRDARFSVDSPLVDVLLSDAAKAVIDRHTGGGVAKIPAMLSGTQAPTFGAIVTLRSVFDLGFMAKPADLAALDARLRALPISDADRAARCARYDDERPQFDRLPAGKPRVLLFGKINGFRDSPSVDAAQAALVAMASRNGWALVTTEKGGAMHPSVLRHFDVVVWNNNSGDVLTLSQRRAFRRFIEGGGGFVGIHGAAGDPAYFWDWYVDTLIGARFIGHPMEPQFQDARITLAPNSTGIDAGLPREWTMNDEWYSFGRSPRETGAIVIASLDENSYKPGRAPYGGPALSMGADHPIAWARCIGRGRAFYSAIGHRPETYTDAHHVRLLEQALRWAAEGSCKKGR